eukprot:Lankesteria_metandrocarpae@DN3438_c0_g1_i1.p1
MRYYIVNCLLLAIIKLNTCQVDAQTKATPQEGKPQDFRVLPIRASRILDASDWCSESEANEISKGNVFIMEDACNSQNRKLVGGAPEWSATASTKGSYMPQFLKAIASSLKTVALKRKALKDVLGKKQIIFVNLLTKQIVRLKTSPRWFWETSSPIKIRHAGVLRWKWAAAYGVEDVRGSSIYVSEQQLMFLKQEQLLIPEDNAWTTGCMDWICAPLTLEHKSHRWVIERATLISEQHAFCGSHWWGFALLVFRPESKSSTNADDYVMNIHYPAKRDGKRRKVQYAS